MGWCGRCCCRWAFTVNDEIKHTLAEQKKKERSEIKILLLGTGESGKTTFIKQMRIIHGKGFTEEERCTYAKLVFQNVFTATKALTGAMTTLKIPYANPQNEVYAQQFQELDVNQMTHLNSMYVEAIHQLWNDRGIKLCYSRRREYQLLDSTEYFMTNLDRIASSDYVPTDQDVLRVRFRSTAVTEHSFIIEKITLRIVDAGGQKSERRKWIHCFEDVTSVIYLASLSEYDQVLEENDRENRMQESLSLFYTTIHSKWLKNASVILFLNKSDVLAEKIQISDLRTYYPKFTGKRRDAQEAMKFIQQLYLHETVCRKTNNTKNLYCHFTCATDTKNIRTVFSNVKDTVLMNSIQEYIHL